MASRFCTGWGVDTLAHLVTGGYFDSIIGGSALAITPGGGPFGGNCLTYTYSGVGAPGYVVQQQNANVAAAYIGFWFQCNANSINNVILQFLDGATSQVFVFIDNGLQLHIQSGASSSGSGGTTLATGAAATLALGRWTFIELGVVFNTSTGSVWMRFNGSDVIGLTGSLNTAPSGNNRYTNFKLGVMDTQGGFFQSVSFNWADMYLLDGTGGSPLNTLLGVGQAVQLDPNANSAVQFTGTPNTGSNTYKNVNVNPSVGTSYNFDNNAGDKDLFTKPALPGTVNTIYFVQVSAYAALDAAGSRTAQVVMLSNGTELDSPSSAPAIGPGYSWIRATYDVDPHTSAAWTITNFNNATFGYKLTT